MCVCVCVWCTYLGTLVSQLHDGQALGVFEERRQLVGEAEVLVDEPLDVDGRLAGRRAAGSVEHAVQLVDDQSVEVVLVADGHRREDDGPLDHLHVHLQQQQQQQPASRCVHRIAARQPSFTPDAVPCKTGSR